MKFIIITGPQAVGKMTVGQELVKITNLKLLHNHMTIEVLTKIFDYSRDSFRKLNEEFRMKIFKEFAKSEEEGIIFTTTWDFEDKEEWNRIYKYIQIFKVNNAEIYIVELEANLEERLKRNKMENRLLNKPSKRNLEWSEKDLLKSVERYRFNSKEIENRQIMPLKGVMNRYYQNCEYTINKNDKKDYQDYKMPINSNDKDIKKNIKNKKYIGREYSEEFLNSLYANVDENL